MHKWMCISTFHVYDVILSKIQVCGGPYLGTMVQCDALSSSPGLSSLALPPCVCVWVCVCCGLSVGRRVSSAGPHGSLIVQLSGQEHSREQRLAFPNTDSSLSPHHHHYHYPIPPNQPRGLGWQSRATSSNPTPYSTLPHPLRLSMHAFSLHVCTSAPCTYSMLCVFMHLYY